jgi:hypothetical protein
MRYFFDEQGRTRLFGEAYYMHAAARKPRRTLLIGKIAI